MADASVSLDLDAKQLYQELQNVTAKFVEFSQKTQSVNVGGTTGSSAGVDEFARGVERATDAEGGFFRSNHRVATQIGRLATELTSGGNAVQVFGQALESAERALNLPLGALGSLVAVGAIAIEIAKVGAAAAKLHEELESLHKEANTNPRFESLSELNKQLEDSNKKFETLAKSQAGFFTLLGEGIFRSFTSEGKNKKLDENILAAEKQHEQDADQLVADQERIRRSLAAKAAEANKVETAKLAGGEFAGEREKIEQKREEEVGAAKGNQALIDQVNKKAALEREAIDRKEAAQQRAVELEEKITQIKRDGRDVEVQTAKAKRDAAQQALAEQQDLDRKHPDLFKHRPGETDAEAAAVEARIKDAKLVEDGLIAKFHAANQEVDHVTRVTQAKKDQLALETQIANIIGTADEKRAALLTQERELLEKRLATAKPDEVEAIQKDLAKNAEQERAFGTQQEEKEFKTREAAIDAGTGRGQLEEIKALQEKIAANAEHIANLRNNPLVDEENLTRAEGQLNSLQKKLEDIVDARRRSTEQAEDELAAVQAQVEGENFLASAIRTASHARAGIERAIRDENPEEVAALEQAAETSLIGELARENIRERHLTPQQRAEEERRKQEEQNEVAVETGRINQALNPGNGSTPVLTPDEAAVANRVAALRQEQGGARADDVKRALDSVRSDKSAKDHGLEKTNTILEKIEKNTADGGANK